MPLFDAWHVVTLCAQVRALHFLWTRRFTNNVHAIKHLRKLQKIIFSMLFASQRHMITAPVCRDKFAMIQMVLTRFLGDVQTFLQVP